jgi:hypothetical protein
MLASGRLKGDASKSILGTDCADNRNLLLCTRLLKLR